MKVIKKEGSDIIFKDDEGKLKRVKAQVFKEILRITVLDRQNNECAICHIDMPEVLLIHHKDGNHLNDNLENLQALCFNCHALVHFNPKVLYKMGDWRGRFQEVKLLQKIMELEKAAKVGTEFCVMHEDRKKDIIIGFDPTTGKPLPQDKYFGLCSDCWTILIDRESKRGKKIL